MEAAALIRIPRAFDFPAVAPLPGFCTVFILKVLKVLCFDTLLQVFIIKVLSGMRGAADDLTAGALLRRSRPCLSALRAVMPRSLEQGSAVLTAYPSMSVAVKSNTRRTQGQLVGGMIEVQVVDLKKSENARSVPISRPDSFSALR
jgi:hypothetical protein